MLLKWNSLSIRWWDYRILLCFVEIGFIVYKIFSDKGKKKVDCIFKDSMYNLGK